MEIRRVGIGSAAVIFAALNALMGLVVGGIFALISVIGAGVGGDPNMPPWLGAIFGFGALVILPVCYGAIGAVGGAIGAAFYNLVAGMVGGLKLEVSALSNP